MNAPYDFYFNGTSGTDVAIHGFEQVDTTGEYGQIGPVFQDTVITRPGLARLDVTLENHGASTVDTDVAIYGSLNMGAWQKLETYQFFGVPAGYVYTHTLMLPTVTLAPGSYRIRLVVNDSGALNETNTTNNELIYPLVRLDHPPSGGNVETM